jgi:hypothetical protein
MNDLRIMRLQQQRKRSLLWEIQPYGESDIFFNENVPASSVELKVYQPLKSLFQTTGTKAVVSMFLIPNETLQLLT